MSFGLGQKICPDFSYEKAGNIPTQEEYDRKFRTQNWYYTYIKSLSIGQGELELTPMQMANIVACIANRGHYMTPHIVRPTGTEQDNYKIEKHIVPIKKEYFDVIIDGMEEAVQGGTATKARVDSVIICGKTGTIQNPHGDDHSAFFAFAPRENPKIAILVYVENGVWGGRNAAPIAGLLIEKYLTGKIADRKKVIETEMFNVDLIHSKKSETAHQE